MKTLREEIAALRDRQNHEGVFDAYSAYNRAIDDAVAVADKHEAAIRRGSIVQVKGWPRDTVVAGIELEGQEGEMIWVMDTRADHGCYKACVWVHRHEIKRKRHA